jgi:hypothetical protein
VSNNHGRKIKRNRDKQRRKSAQKDLQQALNATAGLPTECSECDAKFDFVRDADDWIVENGSSLRLLCPKCVLGSLSEAHN